ncbi:MAG: helix-turn-helix domain-containing protein [Solimonas sp.]
MSRSRTGQDDEVERASRAEPRPRRRYDSPLRRQQISDTRERILVAGSELVHGFPAWDWRGLTFRAVGERAGVSERTVHRYFATERALRDAVVQRLVVESGVSLEQLEVRDFAEVAAKLFAYLSSFAAAPAAVGEPSLVAIDRHRRHLLLDAVVRATPKWPKADREMAASILDMLWNVPSYERLITAWQLDAQHATRAITWVIGLVETAIREGRRPGL